VDESSTLNLAKILDIARRRRDVVIATFIVVFFCSFYLALALPNIYQSSSVILFSPPELPESYVESTINLSMQDRFISVTREILSRTRLEKIIRNFNLYASNGQGGLSMKKRVGRLRKNIVIEPDKEDENLFDLSFESRNPLIAQEVAGILASAFMGETLKLRDERAVGTTAFMKAETERLRKEVEIQEATVNRYKAKYRYELPEQLQANLSTVEQLRRELQSNLLRLSGLQDRKATVQKQLVEVKQGGQELRGARITGGGGTSPQLQQLENMRTELVALLSRYSDRHPDVIRLKREMEMAGVSAGAIVSGSNGVGAIASPVQQILLKQGQELGAEIRALQRSNDMLRKKIAVYQVRVDNTPTRGIELSKITRTYDITLNKYQDLLGKTLDSQLSENMEKRQNAKTFQLVGPAYYPTSPVRPDRKLILAIGFVAALGAGLGLSILLEKMGTSFQSSDELMGEIDLPLLASIPVIKTQAMFVEKRRQQVVTFLVSVATLGIGIFGIRIYSQLFY